MCDFLNVLFCLIFTLNFQLLPHQPILSLRFHNGYAHAEKSCPAIQSTSQACLETPSARICCSFPFETRCNQTQAAIASFQRSSLSSQDCLSHGFAEDRTMEALPVQESMFRISPILWQMWQIMGDLCRPGIRAAEAWTKSSTMELSQSNCRQLGDQRHLDRESMDSIPQKKAVTKTQIQKEIQGRKRTQGKRTGQISNRAACLWTAYLALNHIGNFSMDDLCPSSEFRFSTPSHDTGGHKGGQRARSSNEIFGHSPQKAQRRLAPPMSRLS